jgi:hypothetical protein
MNYNKDNSILGPEDCLIRLCRICAIPMKKTDYDFDSESRFYFFNCENCNFHTRIIEPIAAIFMELENKIEQEPLTSDEEEMIGERNHKLRKTSHKFYGN